MKRFIDLRGQGADGRFAWYDTIRSEFEAYNGEQTWETFWEFEQSYRGDEIDRYSGLAPAWAFDEPEDGEVICPAFTTTNDA